MKKERIFNFLFFFWISLFIFCAVSLAGESNISVSVATSPPPSEESSSPMPSNKEDEAAKVIISSENVTLDFKEADIQNVLKIISYKAGINIVTTPEVMGNVTIRLVDVPWESALDVILKTYGYSYQKQGNIILVTKLENIARLQAEEPLQTEIFSLKYLDAQDAQKILIPLLSPRGKISVLYTRGQKGWQFGTFKIGKDIAAGGTLSREKQEPKTETVSIENSSTGELISRKAEFEPSVKSKIIVITDTVSSLDRIRNVILPTIDKKPKQVLIETRIMEVNKDRLKDLGVDWGTGTSGASGYTTAPKDLDLTSTSTLAGRNLGSEFIPNAFGPKELTTAFTGAYPYSAGAELIFKKVAGTEFEVILHALEEDARTNTLSAPRILTLDNQEASILVGYHTPILASTVSAGSVSSGTGATVTQTLDYYQEIGIRLNVVPQVSEEGFINMIVHPSVTSSTSSVTATSTASGVTTQTSYPIIDVREAQTQVMLKSGETIVIGGLLKDVKTSERIGIPFLSQIPWLGYLFTRNTDDVSKVDLLIFITAKVIEDNTLSKDELAKFEKGVDYVPIKEKAIRKKK